MKCHNSHNTCRSRTKNWCKSDLANLERVARFIVLVFVASLLIAGLVFVMDWAFGVNAADSIWRGVIGLVYELF